MGKSRTQKATLNLITTLLYEAVTFSCGLILPRMILSNYGSTYNGIISSITQFFSLVSILRLGVAGATRAALYKTIAAKDQKGTSAIVRATEIYLRKVGLVILAYIAVLAVAYPYVLKGRFDYWDVVLLVFAAGIGIFAQYYFGMTYQTFLTANQSVYVYNIIQMICTLLNTGLSVYLILQGFSIQIVKLASSVVFFITPVALNIYVSRHYKLDKKCEPDDRALEQKKDVMASSIANIIHENTDIVILTLFCDIKVVSVYTVYNLVMNALKKIQDIFKSGVEAVFGDMWAKQEFDKLDKYLSCFEFIIGCFVSVAFSCTLVLILPFVSLYTKGVHDIEYVVPMYALTIITAQIFFCLRTPYLLMVQGAGKYKETKVGAYFEAGLNLGISVLLVNFLGIIGTAIGTLIANLFRTVQYSFFINKHMLKRERFNLIRRISWILFNIVITCFLTQITGFSNAIDSWSRWIICAFVTGLISVLVLLISSYLFFRKDLKVMLGLLKRAAI